jgi:hypothetical protein
MLAAASIFEGYRWLGAIPADHDLVSRLMFSRSGAAVFAVLALSGVVALTGRTSFPRRLATAVALPAAAVAVITATLLLAVSNDTVNRSVLGAADLVMAIAAVAALVSGERRARPASRLATSSTGSTGSNTSSSGGSTGSTAASRSGDGDADVGSTPFLSLK